MESILRWQNWVEITFWVCRCKGEVFHLYFSELQLLSLVYWLYLHFGPVLSSEYAGSATRVGVRSNNQGQQSILML